MNKKNKVRRAIFLAGSITMMLPSRGADIQKGNNVNPWNTGASWTLGAVPGTSDVAFFDNTLTAANTSALGGSLTIGGIRVTNPAGAVILANTDGATLSIGASGIDMSTATAPFLMEGAFVATANQAWSVANASTAGSPFVGNARQFNNNEDLAFSAGNTAGAGILFDLGGNTVTTTGTGTICITSGYTMANGTLNIGNGNFEIQGGASKLTALNADLTVNINASGKVHFQSNSGSLTSASPINLNGGTLQFTTNNATQGVTQSGPVTVNQASTILVANNVGGGGSTGPLTLSGNLSGSASLAMNNTAANAGAILSLTGDNSGYTGTITLGGTAGRLTRIASSTGGSAAAAWNIGTGLTLQIDGVTTPLGTIAGAGAITNSHATNSANIVVGAGDFSGSISDGTMPIGLTKTGTGTLTLSGFNTYTGATTVNAGSLFATAGSLGTSNLAVADGASFGVKVISVGSTLTVANITSGTTTGSTLSFDLGALGNPIVAPMSVGNLTIQAPTGLRVVGSNLTPGTFPLLNYSSVSGLGIGGISLVLPPRVLGSLANDAGASTLRVTISGFDTPKWTGAVNGKWDIDNGTGTGTTNWKEVNSGNTTRYIQNANGSDSVRFDDSATGTTDVELTNTLLPNGVAVDNSTHTYIFLGAGKISGTTGLTKRGTGTLRLRNSGTNDYTGETNIEAGTLEVGDGVTLGVGSLGTGAITNGGTLILNRPDSYTLTPTVTSTGAITKNGGGIALFSGAFNQTGPVALSGGSMTFSGGGSVGGVVSGPGILGVSAGTFELNGIDPNTNTGMTVVNGGTLRLAKTPGVNAVGGNITIAGGGILTITANEQIPDTATITFTGTSADSMAGSTGTETLANVVVNPSVNTGQFIMRNGFTVTGLATVQNGILGVGSGNSATVNSINMTGGTVRIAGNTAASTLSVGAGGITASGGVIEVKFNTNDQDAVLNLGGDFTATGNVAVNNANYLGASLSQVVLTGTRTFNIAAGTTTTVAPEITGTGGLTKTGTGLLDLVSRAATYTGDTVVSAGTFRTATTQSGTANIFVGDNANLSLRIPLAGTSLATQSLSLGTTTGGTITFDLSGLGNPTSAPLTPMAFTASGANSLVVLGVVTPGTFPLIDYTTPLGAGVFNGLTLKLPLRVAGSLVNNTADSRIDVTILGTDTPKWNGNLSTNWDFDDGTGTGTANWLGFFTGNPVKYLQSPAATDMVLFDDTAAVTNVALATALTPVNATVNNTAKTYTFSGPGKLTGNAVLTKEGPGTLTLVNTVAYDHTGGTQINSGAVQVGDGTTPGVGVLPSGTITNNGTINLNRPDDFDLFATFDAASTGTLRKSGTNTATFVTTPTYAGPIVLSAGKLRFIGGGNLSGVISGSGELVVDGANLQLSGFDENTFTGTTTVVSGTLQLNKGGVNAIGGNIELQNAAALTLTQANQIADTATLIFNKTTGNQVIGNETLGAVNIINGSETAQLQANNGFVVNGLLTMSTGVFSVASNHSGTVGGIDISGGTLRIAANSNPSTLVVGSSGITASGGLIQVGQGTGAFDAVLQLGGNVTATGTLNISDGNFTGAQKREIDLGDTTRVFNVSDLGSVVIAPDIVGTGGLTKSGAGTLTLTAASASGYTGDTTIQAGTLALNGSLSGTPNITVKSGATFDVNGTIGGFTANAGQTLRGSGTIAGPVSLAAGAKLAPGDATGAAGVLTFTSNLDLSLAVDPATTGTLLFDIAAPASSDSVLLNGGSLAIGSGTLEFNDFAFAAGAGFSNAATYTLFDSSTPIVGTLGIAIEGVINGAPFRLQFADGGNDLVLVPVPEPASASLLVAAAGLLGAFRRPRRER